MGDLVMFVNLHNLPAGKSMFTIAVTDQPSGTDPNDIAYDEVDVVADHNAQVADVIAAADLSMYDGCRVIGVVNQSEGYVVVETFDGDLREGGTA
jgi:hypothetical protein